MSDLHNNIIESKCSKAFNAVKTRLEYEYNAVVYNPIEADCDKLKTGENWRGIFSIYKNIQGIEFKLIIAIPIYFPYEFPKVYLSSEMSLDYKSLYSLLE